MTAPQSDEVSLQRRYQQFRAREIEFYKQVVSRQSMMRIAQDASDRILAHAELQLGEFTLAQEVDSMIAARVGVPSFKRWHEVIVIEPDDLERASLETHAALSGWTHLLRTSPTTQPLGDRSTFASVLYSPAACADLTESETVQMIDGLKEATIVGGTHIIDGLIDDREVLPQAMLERSYVGWKARAERGGGRRRLATTRFQKA